MEFVDGQTLGELLAERGRLPQSDVLAILEQVCAALECAHDNGIVHQDIKPDNIMVSTPQNRVKVMDFGLAKLASKTAAKEAGDAATMDSEDSVFVPDLVTTTFSGLMGTAAYMSPEQAKRDAVDYRTDIYSLGVMTYELLTGKKPFRGDSQIEMLEHIVNNQPPELERRGLHISTKWVPIIRRCMEKEPRDRYQAIEDLQHDLAGVKKSTRAHHNGLLELKRNANRKKHKLLWITAIMLLLSVFMAANYNRIFRHSKSMTHRELALPVTTTSRQAYQYFLEGQKAWWRYDMRAAVNSFQMAVEADTSFAYAYALLGVLLCWQDRNAEMKECQIAAGKELQNLKGWEKQLVQGFIYYFDDQYSKMKKAFRKAIELDSTCIDCYLGAALAYEQFKDFDNAIELTKKVIDLDSTHIAAHGNISDMYEWSGDIFHAKLYAEKQLNLILASGNVAGIESPYEALGRFNHYLAKDSLAIHYLTKSLEIDPRNKDASLYLAEVLALGAQIEKAEQVLQSSLSMPLKPEERGTIYEWYGTLMTFTGQWVNAINNFEKAFRLFDQVDRVKGLQGCIRHMCDIYFELNQHVMINSKMQQIMQRLNIDHQSNVSWESYWEIKVRLALKDNDFSSAERIIQQYYQSCQKTHNDIFEAKLAIAQEEYASAIDVLSPRIEKNKIYFRGGYLKRLYHSAYSQNKCGMHNQAIQTCTLALQARRILFRAEYSIYYIKMIALLAELYETTGQINLALAECEKFFLYWQNADPGIPLLVEMQARLARLSYKTAAK